MVSPNPESRYRKVFTHPEDKTFRQWLFDDPHFCGIADNHIRSVQLVIRILDHPTLLSQVNPNFPLTHEDRLALIVRNIGERYSSEQDVFDLFGVNRRTLHTFTMTAHEPVLLQYYGRLQEILQEMSSRRKMARQRMQERLGRRIQDNESLAELAEIKATT